MLILGRRLGERVMIGDAVIVEVISISQGAVSLGIRAPREVPVDREEIWERKQQEKEEKDDRELHGSD